MHTDLLSNLDGLVITNPTNIRYLTGFVGVTPTEREAYVLVTKKAIRLFTNGLYTESARKLRHIVVTQISREHPFSLKLRSICDEDGIHNLGFEETNLTVAELSTLKGTLTGITLLPTRDRAEGLRMTKRNDEIASIRKAAEITDSCFDQIRGSLRPGMTEAEVTWAIEQYMRGNGAEQAFAPIVAFGKNSSMPHYNLNHISKTVLGKNDIVLLDFGARINGYCADMTRVVFTGTPRPEWALAYEAVLSANRKAIDLLTSGQRNGATLDAAAREAIAEADFPVYPHSLGHAVGLDIHEAPRLTIHSSEVLKPHMVVTVEPGVYVEGSFGIRIEDLVLIKNKGIEIVSKSRKELTAL